MANGTNHDRTVRFGRRIFILGGLGYVWDAWLWGVKASPGDESGFGFDSQLLFVGVAWVQVQTSSLGCDTKPESLDYADWQLLRKKPFSRLLYFDSLVAGSSVRLSWHDNL